MRRFVDRHWVFNHKSYTFSVIYRHPHNNHPAFFEARDKRMCMLNIKKKKCLVLGDINIDLNPKNVKPASSDYIHLLQSNAFFSLTTSPTRVTSTSQTFIDHIFTNDYESNVTPGVLTYSLSNHYPMFCIITNRQLQTPKAMQSFEFWNIKSVDKASFCKDLNSALLPLVIALMYFSSKVDFDYHFNRMVNSFSQIINNHAPLPTLSRKKKRLQQKPWKTKGLLTSIKNKQKLYKTCFLNGNDLDKHYFKIYSNKLTKVKNQSKKLFTMKPFRNTKTIQKQLWRFINSIISAKVSRNNSPHLLKLVDENDVIRNPPEISKKFNTYFAEIELQISNTVNTKNASNFKAYLKNSVSQSIFLEPPE